MEVVTIAKHLSYDERLEIEMHLKFGLSLSEISKKLNRHKSTISREIKLRYVIKETECDVKNYNECIKLNSPPYVCNSCKKRNTCILTKKYYSAKAAQKNYEELLIDSRTGIEKNIKEIKTMNNIIKPLVDKGQSIHHIITNNKSTIMATERTIYNYIAIGALSVKNIDLPRKVRYRIRKRNSTHYKVDKDCYKNRKYDDYLKFISENQDISIVQMDTVEGVKGGKVLLTIHFIDTSFMLIFIRNTNDSKSVTECFRKIYDLVGLAEFKKLFQVILTDNGSEFTDPIAIERIGGKEKLTNIFYCNPDSPYLKPEIENNHALVRRIIPKGKSMDNFTPEKATVIMSHINSYTRKKLNDQTPYEAFTQRYGFKLTEALGIKRILANDIILKPSLIK